jgi:hypothetical protein
MRGRPTSWLGLSLTARSSGEAAHGAEMGRARRHCGALTGGSVVAGRRQGSAGKLAGGTGRAPSKAIGVELTRTAVRRGGGGEVSG